MPFARENHRAACPETVPEERFPVKRVIWSIYKRRTQRDDWESRTLMHAEQRSFAHRLIAGIRVGVIVWSERVAFVVVQSVPIGRYAGHEHISAHTAVKNLSCRFYLCAGCPSLRVVGIVVDGVKSSTSNSLTHTCRVIAIGHHIVD